MEHYRCVKCYVPSTNAIRDVDIVKFFPSHITFPFITSEYYINNSATDILAILKTTPSDLPPLEYGNRTKNPLFKIAELLGRSTKKNTIILPVATRTPTMPRIYLPAQDQRVTLPWVSLPVPYHKVPVSQATPYQRVQK